MRTTPSSGSRIELELPDFEAFFEAEFAPLARWSALLVQSQEEGKDLAQEAFARLFVRWASFSSELHARNYVYKIALNLSRRLHRRIRRQLEAIPRERLAMHDASDEVATRLDVFHALSRLAARDREVLLLVDYAGMSISDVSELTGLSSGAGRTALHRARARLRRNLEAMSSD